MAHIDQRKLKSGAMTYHVIYEPANGGKRKITGFTNKLTAQNFCYNLNRLSTLRKNGSDLTAALTEWIDSLSDEVHEQLASDGILPSRIKPGTLQELTEYFLTGKDSQEELKESTLKSRRSMVNRWLEFFGKHRSVTDITTEDARKYAAYHAGKYAPATWGREVKSLKLIFNFAVDELHWIKENPFRKFKGGNQSNKEKLHDVTLEETRLILEECPTAEMRLIFSLARFGGLRIPSELAALDWECINFKRNTLTVNIPKKTGKKAQENGEFATRVTPLWPELRQAFEEYWETLPEGAGLKVFPACPTGQALTSRFRKILKRAGVPMWGNFFKSMRATRDTELRRKFPEYKVNAWIGHTQAVAEGHYILNSVQEIEAASEFVTMGISTSIPMGTKMGTSMGTGVGTQCFYDSCKQFSEVKKNLHFTGLNQENKKGVTSLQRPEMTSMGHIPSASSPVNYDTCETSPLTDGNQNGNLDVKTLILNLFHCLNTSEQAEILTKLQELLFTKAGF